MDNIQSFFFFFLLLSFLFLPLQLSLLDGIHVQGHHVLWLRRLDDWADDLLQSHVSLALVVIILHVLERLEGRLGDDGEALRAWIGVGSTSDCGDNIRLSVLCDGEKASVSAKTHTNEAESRERGEKGTFCASLIMILYWARMVSMSSSLGIRNMVMRSIGFDMAGGG